MTDVITSHQYAQILASAALREDINMFAGTPFIVVDVSELSTERNWGPLPMVPVIGVGTQDVEQHPCIDVFADSDAALASLEQSIKHNPEACATLVQLLRNNATSTTLDGLFAESLAYSTLQQSRVFQAWLSLRVPSDSVADDEPPVLVERHANRLLITLNRPTVHNAYSTAMRDALCEALYLADTDPDIEGIELRGNGPSYCAGGDLSEFGRVQDAAEAHLSRTTRSAGAVMAGLTCHTRVNVHGACIGAGIEVPAFAKQIVAHKDTFFQLPEISFGLVPGAGGTVSITQRIGRHRTAWMALSNARIGADQALAWGLVDAIA